MSGIIGDNVGRSSGLVKSAGGGGVILKVKSMKFTGTASETGTSPTQLSDFDMSFAPTTSDGKLLFQAYICAGVTTSASIAFYFYDVTNSTIIGAYGDSDGTRLQVGVTDSITDTTYHSVPSLVSWHEPGTTSSIDYTIFGNAHETKTLFINRNNDWVDTATIDNAVGASTFTITEYAASTVTLT